MHNFRNALINNNWEFKLLPLDSGYEKAVSEDGWKSVDLPHDWLIYDTNNLYADGQGWYRRKLEIDETDGKCIRLYFDGIYMDSHIFVNGTEIFRHTNGYTAFYTDVTKFVHKGENEIAVQVDYCSPNSRWYSGSGIFRDVELVVTNDTYIDNVYVSAYADGKVMVNAEFIQGEEFPPHRIVTSVYNADGEQVACGHVEPELPCSTAEIMLNVENPVLWDLDNPYLYTVKTEIVSVVDCENIVVDKVTDTIGFRETKFDPNEGFFLNGKYMKLKGVCLHHDLGCLGAAVNYRATERQVMLMKKMGANAIRTAHNMPSRQLIDICNKHGMLVVSECFDMWELEKTKYDNARFFKETADYDVECWVKRDRNAPCVIMWSIGNEIYDTHASEHGYEIAERLVNAVRANDPRENARATIGSNFIEWEGAQKIGKMLGISGYNYTERCYDAHHKKYPDTIIYGSETSSAVRSRGIYHFPASVPMLSHDDKQCSSLANSCVGWGRPSEDAWIQDRNRKFCAGQFVWTGIDYIGEPTPYDTKNSYFGMADTCCFPKDIYYFYQSVWSDEPMVHLLPYWDFNEGQEIDVIAYTSLPNAELFLNGKSLGVQKIDHINGDKLHAHWIVPYEKGEIRVKAMDNNGNVIAEDFRRSFGDPIKVTAKLDKATLSANGTDLAFIEIGVADNEGNPVENARNRVSVEVSGAGRLVGMDNGDSTDYEQFKVSNRKLFSGKALAVIGTTLEAGEIHVKITSEGLEPCELVIVSENAEAIGVSAVQKVEYTVPVNDVPARKIELICDNTELNENNRTFTAQIKLLPENATFNDITCKLVKENGVEANIAECEYTNGNINVTAKGDGEAFLRVYASNGGNLPQVISYLKFTVCGLGDAFVNPYSFVSASTYSISNVPLNIIENGALGGFTQQIYAGFAALDFGKVGADKFRLYFGNCCNKDIPVEIWDGVPGEEGSVLLTTAMFPHNNGWGSFEPYDFELGTRLKDIHTLCFVISDKCIFGGFEFAAEEKAFAKLSASDNDEIYGDDYTINGDCVEKIGNNVVLSYNDMDFGSGTTRVIICGRTPNDVNSIQFRNTGADGVQKSQVIEFAGADEYIERSFEIAAMEGRNDISFVFMPGSNFDFAWFRFEKTGD
ncbi:MAG: DUF4982 domain-containing protein [Oscillospiraceae bacterium]|nr:DUF4982 domain-containing protein [Oscillospiraceae bacterium]